MREAHIQNYPILSNSVYRYQGNDYDVLDLYLRFESSIFGEYQAEQQPRFHKRFPIGDHKTHLELLGADTHPVKHMIYTTADLTIPAVKAQASSKDLRQFEQNESSALIIASAIHDIDECEHPEIEDKFGFVVGDVPSIMVTAEDDIKKSQIRKDFMYPTFYSDLPDNLISDVENIITHNKSGISGDAFRYIEKVGYLTTALTASNLAVKYALSPEIMPDNVKDLIPKLVGLVQDVRKHNEADLKTGARDFEFVSRSYYYMLGRFTIAEHQLEEAGVV